MSISTDVLLALLGARWAAREGSGATEAINGRLEALRRNALGSRNLTHYRLRSLLHCGNLIQQIDHSNPEEPLSVQP